MNTVEEAYEMLAESIVDFIKDRNWNQGICKCQILSQMASASHSFTYQGSEDQTALGWPKKGISAGGAALFLRDDLLKTTGQRIWGLTFTLFPDGKFRIEYDYEKPEGYEETEEAIDIDLNTSIPGQTPDQ